MSHECIQEEELGKIKEFISGTKGMRTAISGIVVAILLQVGTFLYLWGGIVTTVKSHDKSLEKVCNKLENIHLIGYSYAEEKEKQHVKTVNTY